MRSAEHTDKDRCGGVHRYLDYLILRRAAGTARRSHSHGYRPETYSLQRSSSRFYTNITHILHSLQVEIISIVRGFFFHLNFTYSYLEVEILVSLEWMTILKSLVIQAGCWQFSTLKSTTDEHFILL